MRWFAGLFVVSVVSISSPFALAAAPGDLNTIQNAQHDFVTGNGGSPSLELSIETLLARDPSNTNFALLDQIEGTGNKADIHQSGGGNTAAVIQGFGDYNQAYVDQEGAGNFALVTQAGSGNVVSQLLQSGNNNRVVLTQQDGMNTASVTQYNDNNQLRLSQANSYNSATVEQYGNTALDVTQTNPGGSAASENQLLVKAWAEAGAQSNFQPISLSGAGNTKLYLCSGSAAYCNQVLPPQ